MIARWAWIVVASSAGIILLVLVMLAARANKMNDKIDRCDDPTSGKYIDDPKLFFEVCGRPKPKFSS